MEVWVRRLANKVAQSLGYDAEKESVIAYGLIAITQVLMTVILALAAGLLIHAPAESMIVCFSVSILRRFSGGAHADSLGKCTFITVVACTLFAFLSRFLAPFLTPLLLTLVTLVVYTLVYTSIYRYAPVASPHKPIKTEQKRLRMRRGCYRTMAVYVAVQTLLIIASLWYPGARSLAVSLILGVAWQAFTLTNAGNILLNKLNVLPEIEGKEDVK
jgi:accessory gene regulator B